MSTKACSQCKVEKELSEFYKDKNKKGGLRNDCKSCKSSYRKGYYTRNATKEKDYNKRYYKANKSKVTSHQVEYQCNKRLTDQAFKDNSKFRQLIKGYRTAGADNDEIDAHRLVSKETYSAWLQYQREAKKVVGPEDIDHCFPVSKLSAKVPHEFLLATNVVNLSPMNASENRSKGAKIIPELLQSQITIANNFLRDYYLDYDEWSKFAFLVSYFKEFVELVTFNLLKDSSILT